MQEQQSTWLSLAGQTIFRSSDLVALHIRTVDPHDGSVVISVCLESAKQTHELVFVDMEVARKAQHDLLANSDLMPGDRWIDFDSGQAIFRESDLLMASLETHAKKDCPCHVAIVVRRIPKPIIIFFEDPDKACMALEDIYTALTQVAPPASPPPDK